MTSMRWFLQGCKFSINCLAKNLGHPSNLIWCRMYSVLYFAEDRQGAMRCERLDSADISRIEPGRLTPDESLSELPLRYDTVWVIMSSAFEVWGFVSNNLLTVRGRVSRLADLIIHSYVKGDVWMWCYIDRDNLIAIYMVGLFIE